MRRVLGLVLAAQNVRSLGRHATEHLIFTIDQKPLALDLAGLCVVRLHCSFLQFLRTVAVEAAAHVLMGRVSPSRVCFQKCRPDAVVGFLRRHAELRGWTTLRQLAFRMSLLHGAFESNC